MTVQTVKHLVTLEKKSKESSLHTRFSSAPYSARPQVAYFTDTHCCLYKNKLPHFENESVNVSEIPYEELLRQKSPLSIIVAMQFTLFKGYEYS